MIQRIISSFATVSMTNTTVVLFNFVDEVKLLCTQAIVQYTIGLLQLDVERKSLSHCNLAIDTEIF